MRLISQRQTLEKNVLRRQTVTQPQPLNSNQRNIKEKIGTFFLLHLPKFSQGVCNNMTSLLQLDHEIR